MKHIKPGRGPSMQGGIIGIFMIGFGILWIVSVIFTKLLRIIGNKMTAELLQTSIRRAR